MDIKNQTYKIIGRQKIIWEQVGHTDERTTYGNYCYNRKSSIQTQAMEKALAHPI